MTDTKPDRLTDGETADLMRSPRVTVRRLRYRGELPTTRIGAGVFIPRAAVEEFISADTTTAGAR